MTKSHHRKKVGYTAADVKALREFAAMTMVSIDRPISEDSDSSLGDLLLDESAIDPQSSAVQEDIRRLVDEMLKSLGEREQRILRLKFGFGSERPWTMGEIGKEFNLSRERVRQLEVKAMRALRHPSRMRRLAAIMDVE